VSQPDALARSLHAYHDGELGWWGRWRFERRLSRSLELREELESLRRLSELTRESEAELVLPSGVIWQGIEGRLRAVDAAIEAEGPSGIPSRDVAGPISGLAWRPFAAAAAAVGALALFLVLRPASVPTVETATVSGAVRYLDAGERSVLVHEREDVTIIWVMGGTEDVL